MNTQGLTESEAIKKLSEYGFNELPEHKRSWYMRLLTRLRNPIVVMIEVAAILSAAIGQWEDFAIIIVLLVVNVGVDFLQENQALTALAALKSKLARTALVYRDGLYKTIEARLLVPGDIVKLNIGDVVPADVRLIEGPYLQVDQSMLTGESLPVSKSVGEEVYGNAFVKLGSMVAQVTATGEHAFFGKTATLVKRAGEQSVSHFERAVQHIGHFLIALTSVLAIVILLVSTVYRHDPLLESLHFILVLMIASIPVALPAVLSVTMAVGAVSISKFKAIVHNISSIEELAGVDILCADKTGTLTQNRMSVLEPMAYYDFTQQDVCAYAVLASKKEDNDPIELPLFEYYDKHYNADYFSVFTMHTFTPFDPIIKHTEVAGERDGEHITIIKGAPQVVIEQIGDEKLAKKATQDVLSLAQKGYRTLAVAARFNTDEFFSLVGLIPLYDPPQVDSKEVIQHVQELGIKVKMLTGDNKAIAVQIAELLSLGTNILDTSNLKTGDVYREYAQLASIIAREVYKKVDGNISQEDVTSFGVVIATKVKKQLAETALQDGYIKKHESEVIALIERADGFSQVLPEDKYFIVDKLQKNNHIVAMTGDGVNDAPALEKADVGIAVAGATDAARAAADLVLLAPGLSVINHAVRISRETFERMKGYATFRIAETIRIILFITLSIVLFDIYPMTALMIIMLALLNDIPVMMVAYDNAPTNKHVVRWNMKEVLTIASVLGITGVLSSILLLYGLFSYGYSLVFIQAIMFLKLDLAGHSTLYLTRAGKYHFWHKPFPSLKFFLPAFATRIIGTLIAVYGIFMEPIGWQMAGYIWIYSLVWWLFNDFVKVYTYKIIKRHRLVKMHYT